MPAVRRAVHVGRVEKVDAEFERAMKGGDRFPFTRPA
jgi:hypothetical protein